MGVAAVLSFTLAANVGHSAEYYDQHFVDLTPTQEYVLDFAINDAIYRLNQTEHGQTDVVISGVITKYPNGNIRVPIYGKYPQRKQIEEKFAWDAGQKETYLGDADSGTLELSPDGLNILNWRHWHADKEYTQRQLK